jgi:hypothetical protein
MNFHVANDDSAFSTEIFAGESYAPLHGKLPIVALTTARGSLTDRGCVTDRGSVADRGSVTDRWFTTPRFKKVKIIELRAALGSRTSP